MISTRDAYGEWLAEKGGNKDMVVVEQSYRMEGRTMTMILAPAPNR